MKSKQKIKAALLRKGYTEEDAEKIATHVRQKGEQKQAEEVAKMVAGVKT